MQSSRQSAFLSFGVEKKSRSRSAKTRGRMKIYHSQKWADARKALFERFPVCQSCGENRSTDAHHIVHLRDGGAPFDLDNLKALCASCHRAEHSSL